MYTFGPDYNLIIYIQIIIWFVLIGYLINLIIKNKLTYVDEFRQKIVSGIFFKIFFVSCILIFQIAFQIPQDILILSYSFMIIGLLGYFILTQIGIAKLIKHIRSIIDFETKNKRNIAILGSTIITIILSIIYAILRLNDPTQYILLYMRILLDLVFYFGTIYTILLHREMRDIDLNVLLYLGLSYLCIALCVFPSIFWDVRTDMIFWVNTLTCLIILNIFLIIGYLDFKKRISRGLAK